MGVVMQVVASAFVIFAFVWMLAIAVDELPKPLKIIGNICFYIIPIGLIIQIWQ